jgi:lysylphosphatidylglycerol synthetase-like protein (DUF2156 family)
MTNASASPAADPTESRVTSFLDRFGDHSSMALALNRDVEHYFDPGGRGMIAFRRSGGNLIQICGPFCANDERSNVLYSFLTWAGQHGQTLTAVQLRKGDAELYAEHGFSVNQFGCSYSIDLRAFTLRGTRFMKVRNKISRARRRGLAVEEIPDHGQDSRLDAIDREWLREKGRHVNELAFLVGERGGAAAPLRRIFLARQGDRPLAYATYSPVLGNERPGWLYDLTRRRRNIPPGTIELIFSTALEAMRAEGVTWLHLGLTPFVGLADDLEIPGSPSRIVSFLGRQIAEHGEFVYPAKSQEAFKSKWAPDVIEPEYIAFHDGPSIRATIGLLRLTRVIPW